MPSGLADVAQSLSGSGSRRGAARFPPAFQPFPGTNDSLELVGWVYPKRLPWPACTPPTSFSSRQLSGAVTPPAASCDSEALYGLRHPCAGKMRDPFRRQGSEWQATVCPTPSGGVPENLSSAKTIIVVKPPPSPGDTHDASRQAPRSSQRGNPRATCVCGRWPEHYPGGAPEFQDLMRSAVGPDCNGVPIL